MLLMNLLTNALKYNDAEQAKIAISFERLENKVRIAFSDNGRGLARKECRKIFKKFYQINNTDQTSSGSGLGLYLVDKIAKIHQGKIKVKSPGIGQGATFTLILPSAGRDRKPTWS
jgi:signal transduction histidine kinase